MRLYVTSAHQATKLAEITAESITRIQYGHSFHRWAWREVRIRFKLKMYMHMHIQVYFKSVILMRECAVWPIRWQNNFSWPLCTPFFFVCLDIPNTY